MSEMDTAVGALPEVETKEAVGLWMRFAARLVDWILIFFVVLFCAAPFTVSGTNDSSLETYLSCAGQVDTITVECDRIRQEVQHYAYYSALFNLSVSTFYFVLLTASPWQGTVGKRLFRLRVVSIHGLPLNIGQSFMRHLPWITLNVLGFVGYSTAANIFINWPIHSYLAFILNGVVAFQIGLTDKKQGMHDTIAGSLVLREGKN